MGIITDTLTTIDAVVGSIAEDAFTAGAAAVGNTITGGAVLLLALMGANVALQIRPMTLGSTVAFGIRLVVVSIFAQSWANFSVIYAILTDVPQSIGNGVLAMTDVGDAGGLYGSLDLMLARVTEYGDAISDGAGWLGGAVLTSLFFLLSAAFAAVAAGILAFATIMLTVMIVVGPFAIVCSLFKATNSIFEAWSQATIGYAAMPIVTGVVLGVVASAGERIMITAVLPEDVAAIDVVLPFVTIMLLSIGVMATIPSLSQNITGAFGLASNAAGLTGTMRRGMIDAGTGGMSAAARMVTGKSPAQLRHAVNDRMAHSPLVDKPARTAREVMATTQRLHDYGRTVLGQSTALTPATGPSSATRADVLSTAGGAAGPSRRSTS